MTSELDPQARELIGLAMQGERRLPRNRERVRRGVLAAVVAPAALGLSDAALAAGKVATVAGSGAGTKAALLSAATWLKVAPAVLVGVAAVAGVQQLRPTEPSERVAKPAVVSAPAKVSLPAPPLAQPVAPARPPLEATPDPAPSAPVKTSRASDAPPCSPARPLSPVPCPPSPAAPPSLATELEALQRAQRSLNAGNAASALSELRAVSGPALRAERTALEVFAHCALGNVSQARQQAALFRRLAPGSPLLPRVDASCAGE